MDYMIEFFQAAFLICVLTIISLFTAENIFACIFLAGVLIIIYSIRSFMDREYLLISIVQLIIAFLFAAQSELWAAFLVFYEIRVVDNTAGKRLRLLMPMTIYVFTGLLLFQNTMPVVLLNMIILGILTYILSLSDTLIRKYVFTQKQILHAMSVTALNELYEKKINHELVVKNYLAEKNARLEERENISRSIHNSVGHSITAAIMTLDAADMLFDSAPGRAREKMQAANERIHTSLDSIRHAVRVLDTENECISIEDFISELKAVTEDFVIDTMNQVSIDDHSVPKDILIQREHTEFLTGAVEELLSNGVRHGGADLFTVSLTADTGHILIRVCDNGHSDFSDRNKSERIKNGFGLKKLASYVEKCGGSIAFSNENGFDTRIMLPLLDKHDK